ncbi:MAG: methyltransferase domain-containing protein [Deltaproteobacteria bacterium]|nr:methyltransferase domain-containing protein [Deltaproteobacteria bacterium]
MTRAGDRGRVGRAFHRHSGEYDRHASVQKRVVARLEGLVAAHGQQDPARLLDIGCGTGAMLSALAGRYPEASLCGLDLAFNMARHTAQSLGGKAMLVNGDAELLPFRDGAFDLVVSASTFQWVERLDACFGECRRVLNSGGLLCVAFFGGRTLWELQESYREAVALRFGADDARRERMHRFRDVAEVRRALSGLGCNQLVITTETEMEYHADVPDLLRSIKAIGAATAARSDTAGGLGWRRVLTDMAAIYRERFMEGGMIPATYEVIYVVARRAG